MIVQAVMEKESSGGLLKHSLIYSSAWPITVRVGNEAVVHGATATRLGAGMMLPLLGASFLLYINGHEVGVSSSSLEVHAVKICIISYTSIKAIAVVNTCCSGSMRTSLAQ